MQPFELQKCLTLSGESVKCVSFLFDHIDTSKVLMYVGTNKGTLTAYHINRAATLPSDTRNDYDAEELCSQVILRKRPLRQIQAVGGAVQGVVVLCDGKVSLHHLRSLAPLQHFDRHRQATLFCVNKTSGDLRYLCVAENRKITLYSYSKNYAIIKEILIDEVALSLEWLKQSLVVGFRTEYRLIDVHSDQQMQVSVPLDENTQPLIKLLPEREMLLCTRSHDSHLAMPLNFNGSPCRRPPLIWNSPPLQIGYCFPYVVALTTQRRIEVHNYVNLSCTHSIQTLNLAQGVSIVDCSAMSGNEPHDFDLVLVASPTAIMQVKAKPFSVQVEELLAEEKVEEAYTLVQKTARGNDQQKLLESFNVKAGTLCYTRLEFDKCFNIYWDRTTLDPREYIGLFPEFCVQGDTDAEHFVPKLLRIGEIVSDKLTGVPDVRNITVITLLMRQRNMKETEDEPSRKLRMAVQFLVMLMFKVRQRVQKGLAEVPADAWVALDTAVVKALLFLDGGEFDKYYNKAVEFVCQSDNKCSIPDLETHLTASSMYLLLAKLLFQRGHSKRALAILQSLGTGEVEEANTTNGPVDGVDAMVEYLCDEEFEKSHDVIFRCCDHILTVDPFKVLPVVKQVRDPPLDSQRVLSMLENFSDVRVVFLEHMVKSSGFKNSRSEEYRELTTRLAQEYVQQMMAADEEMSPRRQRKERGTAKTNAGTEFAHGIMFLKTNKDYNAEEVYAKTRDRLDDPSLSNTSLLQDVKVQLLGKLGRHQEALQILIYVLNDHNKAEDYCIHNQPRSDDAVPALKKASSRARHKRGNGFEGSINPFIVLLRMLFTEQEPSKKQVFKRRALKILNVYTNAASSASSAYINPMEALSVLPDDISVKDLETYLKNTIRQTTTVLRNSSVKVNILRFKNLKTNVRLHDLQSRKVIVYPSSRCPVCKDAIYADQVISVFPNDDIYHLACSPTKAQLQQKMEQDRAGNPFGMGGASR